MKIFDCYNEFQKSNIAKGLSAETILYYEVCLKKFFLYLKENNIVKISKISENIITQYILELRSSKITGNSINTYLRAARRFMNYANQKKYSKTPIIKLIKVQETMKQTFSLEEVDIIFSKRSEGMVGVISFLLLGTGIRTKTLINARVQDIDFDLNSLIFKTTKNKRLLMFPLTESVIKVLKNHIINNGLLAHDYLFNNTKGGQYTRHTLWRVLEKFLKSCNIEKTGIHIFRHTFSKLLVMNGCDAFTLQEALMHRTMAQSKRYVQLYSNELRLKMNQYNPTAKLLI